VRVSGYSPASAPRWALAVFVLLGFLGALPAQPLDDILSQAMLDTPSQDAIRAIVSEAEKAGVPREPLLDRLQEGIAKSVPGARIVSALETEAANLERVRTVVTEIPEAEGLLADRASWERAAILLRAGWSNDRLRDFVRLALPKIDAFREVSDLYLALVDRGVGEDRAAALTGAAVRSSVDPDDYAALVALLADAQRRRINPDEASQMITDALEDGRSFRQIRNLFAR
jgi:hypothetical protein